MIDNQKGALSFTLVLMLAVCGATSAGILIVLNTAKRRAENQLQADECVGKAAHSIRGHMRAIESGNGRMRAIRIALIPARAVPATEPPLRAALYAQWILLQKEQLSWRLLQTQWFVGHGCPGRTIALIPLPASPWVEEPPDALGPRPLKLSPSGDGAMQVLWRGTTVSAAAEIRKTHYENKWQAHWIHPIPGFFRASPR